MALINGVVVGTVKSLEDPQGEGRLEVGFEWLPGKNRSFWAPVAVALAGGKRGSYFMPEVQDECLVAFEQGDVNHPYIIGFLWNGADKPPETDPNNRVIVTPGGHTLRFEDGDAGKKIVIRTSGGQFLTLDDTGDGTITLKGGGRKIEITGGQVRIS